MSKKGIPDMSWNGTNNEWTHSQQHARPFGAAHLVIGGIMLLCDLLLFLVFARTFSVLVHVILPVFVVFAGAAMLPLLLGIRLLWTSTYARSSFHKRRNVQHRIQVGVVSRKEQTFLPIMHRPGKVEWLERLLLLFFFLATLGLVVLYVVTPSLYVTKLLLFPPPTDPYPMPITLFLGSIVVFVAVVMVGVIQHWQWVFWLLLVAFGCSFFELPAILLQFIGLLPGQPPIWYGLSQIGVALLEVGGAVWMFHIYHYLTGQKAPVF